MKQELVKTKTKYLAFDDTEFNTEQEVLAYEKVRSRGKKQWEVDGEFNKIFVTKHVNDTYTKEHCIFTGKLCNTYKEETSHHNGDYYRGDLTEIVIHNHRLLGACMCEEKALEFIDEMDKLFNKLKS